MSFNFDDLTIYFTVGGNKTHYDSMHKCIKSIKNLGAKPKFLVIELGDRLSTCDEYRVVNLPDVIDFTKNKKIGYIIWKHKYIGFNLVDTRYGLYVDTDTVAANQTFEHYFSNIKAGILVSQHFWVPTIQDYNAKAVQPDLLQETLSLEHKIGLKPQDKFFAGGVIGFEKTPKTEAVFNDVVKMYDNYYGDKSDYVRSVTDELFFAAALAKSPDLIRNAGGALNHCSMGEEYMPMTYHNEILYGKNPYEELFAPITFLHCDVNRRDPSEKYTGQIKETIRKKFEL